LTVAAFIPPRIVMLPLDVRLNTLPVEAPKLRTPLLVSVTLPEVFAVKLVVLVIALIEPEPEVNVRVGADTMPAVAVMLPAPSAARLAELVAVRLAPIVIEPPEPVVGVRLTVPTVI